MQPKSRNDILKLLTDLATALEPHKSDQAADRARMEVLWLKQEISVGRLDLPVKSTKELYLCYAVSEGLFDDYPKARMLAEQLVDAILKTHP